MVCSLGLHTVNKAANNEKKRHKVLHKFHNVQYLDF